jgi:SagB-type dehydrogenase family enzyme
MKKNVVYIISLFAVILTVLIGVMMFDRFRKPTPPPERNFSEIIKLPAPSYHSSTSIEQALRQRRSIREYKDEFLTQKELSQLLWAAQGITAAPNYRTAPSAGALYPLEIYVISGEVEDLPAGVYKYLPHEHGLAKIAAGDRRAALSRAALSQDFVRQAPVVLGVTAIFERTTVKYGQRGIQYVHMEVGSVAQNVYLQAESLGLGTVFVGAFYDDEVKEVLDLEEPEMPLCLLPVGRIIDETQN